MQGILRLLRNSDNSQVSDEYKEDMYSKGKGSEGGARSSGRLSSLQRSMRPFRRTADHLEFRTVEDVEGRMEIPSPLTEVFRNFFLKSMHDGVIFNKFDRSTERAHL